MIEPIGKYIAVKIEADRQSEIEGFELARSSKERPVVAQVFAVGDEVSKIHVGEKVCYTKYAPSDVEIDGVTYFILKEEDILARIT